MTKRFQVTDNRDNPFLCDWNVTDYADGGIVHHPMTSENMANVMCELLNELHEENQKCKEYNAILYSNTAKNEKELLKENEQLKELIKEKCPLCGCDLAHYYKVNGKLEDLE